MIVSRKVVVSAVAGRGDRRNTNDMMTAWDPWAVRVVESFDGVVELWLYKTP